MAIEFYLKEKQILQLEKEFEELSKKRDQLKPNPELLKLTTEQEKLKYRIQILEKVYKHSFLNEF